MREQAGTPGRWRCAPIAGLCCMLTVLSYEHAVHGQQPTASERCTLPQSGGALPVRSLQQRLTLAQSQINRATHDYQAERYEDAIQALRAAYALRPQPDILFNLAQSCRALGEQSAALLLFEEVIKTATTGPVRDAAQRDADELRALLAKQLDEQARRQLDNRQLAAAIATWGSAYSLSPRSIFLFRIAQAQRQQGDLAAALQSYERFVTADPSAELSTEAKEQMVRLRAQQLDIDAQRRVAEGRYGQAIASWDAAFKLDAAAIFLYRRAEAEARAGLIREALSSYEHFLAADPTNVLHAEAQRARAQLRARLREDEAQRLYAERRYAEAIAAWADAEQLRPDPLHGFHRAEAQRLLGQRDAARQSYLRFLDQKPDAEHRLLAERRVAELDAAQRQDEITTARRHSKPLYQRWWLWTSITVGVGTVLGVALATQLTIDPSYPNLRVVQLQEAIHVR